MARVGPFRRGPDLLKFSTVGPWTYTNVGISGAESTAQAGLPVAAFDVPAVGSASTSAAGTVVPSAAVPTTGQFSTSAAGTATPQSAVPAVGSASTSAAGTLVPNSAIAVTGSSATASAGTVWVTLTDSKLCAWFLPESGTAGDAYWVRFTKLSGTVTLAGGGSWLALTSNRTATITNATPGTTATGSIKVEIASDSAGTTIVSTGTFSVSLQVT